MKSFFLFLVLWIPCLQANLDQVSYSEDDPYVYEHVHVISGFLNLSFHDGVSLGAKSIPIVRTYTSSGALERNRFNSDINFKTAGGNWLSQGGWGQFVHVTLFLEDIYSIGSIKAYVANSAGSVICYRYSHEKNDLIILKPEKNENQVSGIFSGRNCISNSEVRLCPEKGEAWIYFPDGSRRLYLGSPYVINDEVIRKLKGGNPQAKIPTASCFYHLDEEVLSTQHCYKYTYDENHKLTHISFTNPNKTKTFSYIDIEYTKTYPTLEYTIRTSDGKELRYSGINHEQRQYLDRVDNGPCHKERLAYIPGRKGTGARLQNVDFADLPDIRVFYYLPEDIKKERKWAKKPHKKDFHIDKVRCIKAPVGKDGEMITIASFEYFEGKTDVRNVEGFLTRYHYKENHLTKIEYFGEKDSLHSSEVFYWNGQKLRSKAALDEHGKVLFAKTFEYDEFGNVLKETTWGYFTGEEAPLLTLNQEGLPSGGESYSKFYRYLPTFNLPVWEEEESGIGYKYVYLPDSSLLTAKYTYYRNQIISREFYSYNSDLLLIEQVVDDGIRENSTNLSNVSQRKIKRFQLNPHTGLVQAIRELYWDPNTRKEHLLIRTERKYSPANQVIEEDVYNANEEYSYTIHTSYDEKGRVTCRTTPLGRKNTQQFDKRGRLLETKKVGKTRKRFIYNASHKPTETHDIDFLGNKTVTYTTFDLNGRPVLEINPQGHIKEQMYDAFGRCVKSFLPKFFDESHNFHIPCIQFAYDPRGNIISSVSPNKTETRTTYNTYRKPVLVIHPDKTNTRYFYSKTGLLIKIIHPDLTEEHFSYDFLGRKTSEKIVGQDGQIFMSKKWQYSFFQLESYTDEKGLKTNYFYDGSGRKIKESANNRSRSFYYDALSFLRRVEEEGISHIQVCNEEGEIVEQWDEDIFGNKKSQMSFIYNDEGFKIGATRLTSQGIAIDSFEYDGKGRLSKHINPLGEVFLYTTNEFHKNKFGQQVTQKVTTDPQNNQTIETYNAQACLAQKEKKNERGLTVSIENLFYDGNGNQTKKVSYVFKSSELVKKLSIAWEYDSMGRKIRQIEDHEKQTEYEYDLMGRLKRHTLPNKTQLLFSYDAAGRKTQLISSDQTLHYKYTYEESSEPTEIIDVLKDTSIKRKYNYFGELIEEVGCNKHRLSWDYDALGRCTSVHLPDKSSINYQYEGLYLSSVFRQDPQKKILYEHLYQGYTPTGQVTKEQYILGLGQNSTSYDILERPSQANNSWFAETLTYNTLGLVENVSNTRSGNKTFSYDSMYQLKQEGEKLYEFDSLGNPGEFEVGICSQIIQTPDYKLKYDPNGNPTEKKGAKGAIQYHYDALDRLISIIYPNSRKVEYFYDPLSRLISKTVTSNSFWSGEHKEEFSYLYDHSFEIGTINSVGEIQELKVLGGRGLGDIGSAIAIELNNEVFLPIHDFRGNIVLLISQDGKITESYEYSAFSQEASSRLKFKNPWRFSSKRSEEHLILFGERFYDPSLKRWLTPDPAGFVDGVNLYVYVLNNPVNRLDLFGLYAKDLFDSSPFSIYAPCDSINSYESTKNSIVIGEAYVNNVRIDVVMNSVHWQNLKITPVERESGKLNLVDHLAELLPNNGRSFGLIIHGNGIKTSLSELVDSVQSIARKIPEGTFIMGLYNETNGTVKDYFRAKKEIKREITDRITDHAQIFGSLLETVNNINPEMLIAFIPHSEYGAITELMPELLSPHQKEICKKQVYVTAQAPALPVSRQNYFEATNTYSEHDRITKRFSKPYMNKAGYDISIVSCKSKISEWSMYFADHAFLGTTYQRSMRSDIEALRDRYGFYDGKNY